MKLNKPQYTIDADLLQKVLEVLHSHWFGSEDDGDGYAIEYNNDDIIGVTSELEAALAEQDKKND